MKIQHGALLLTMCLGSSLSYAEQDYLYTVKPGDTLSTLSQNVLDTSKRWPEVAKYNHLKNVHVIKPGEVLRIQLPWLKNAPAEAVIESLTGAVTLNGQPAKIGDKVASGAKLETPAGGNARMSLPDGSSLSMLEKTQLEATKLDKRPQGQFFNSIFRLVTGRIDAIKKKYPEGQAPLRIQAMHGTIGVRGTHFRMGQEQGNTLAEIENGLVSFGDEQVAPPVALAQAQGSVGDGVHTPVVIPLLPAPSFPSFANDLLPQAANFVMPDMAGAHGYRGELSADEKFTNTIAPIASDNGHIQLGNLAEGRYWLRLRAVDEHGLQGMTASNSLMVKQHAAAPAVKIQLVPTSVSLINNRLAINWDGRPDLKYQCQVSSSLNFNHPLVDIVVKDHDLGVPSPDAGEYFARVRAMNAEGVQGEWSEVLRFTVH